MDPITRKIDPKALCTVMPFSRQPKIPEEEEEDATAGLKGFHGCCLGQLEKTETH